MRTAAASTFIHSIFFLISSTMSRYISTKNDNKKKTNKIDGEIVSYVPTKVEIE